MRRSALVLGVALSVLATASATGKTRFADVVVRRRQPRARHSTVLRGVKAIGQPWLQLIVAALITRRLRRDGIAGARAVLASVATTFVADRLGKKIVRRPRPRTYRGSNRGESFPSGHTAATAALTFSVARVLETQGIVRPPLATLAAVCLTACMAETRLALDEHWITDVLGGALLGGTAAAAFAPQRPQRVSRSRSRGLAPAAV